MNKRIEYYFRRGKSAFLRFYPALFFAIVAALIQSYWLFRSGVGDIFSKNPLVWSATAIIAFFMTLSATLITEQMTIARGKDNWRAFVWTGAIILILLSFFRIDGMGRQGINIYLSRPFMTLFVASGMTVLYAGKLHNERNLMPHVIAMAIDVLVAYIYAFALFVGMMLLFLAGDLLLGVVDFSQLVPYVATICFMPVMALFFLARIPAAEEEHDKNRQVLLIIENLFNNILVPIMSIYVILVYIYLAKILIFRQLPTTSVVNLILWPLCFSVLILFIVDYNRERTSTYYFRKYFPMAALPLLALMYYAWFLRISQYGITENRYMVFALGLWIAFGMVHFIVEKRVLHMILPMTLTVIFYISVFGGPIGAENVAFRSQFSRLNKILVNNQMLKGNKIVPSEKLSAEEKAQIQEIVMYLVDNHDVSHIPYLRGGASDEAIEEVFGFKPEDAVNLDLSIAVDESAGFDISGYDRLFFVESYTDESKTYGDMPITRSQGVVSIGVEGKGKEAIVVDLKDIREKIRILKETKDTLAATDLMQEGETTHYRYRVYFTRVQFYSTGVELEEGDGVSMYVLLKRQ